MSPSAEATSGVIAPDEGVSSGDAAGCPACCCGVCVLVLLSCLRSGAASFCLQTLLLVAYLKLQSMRSEIIECIVCGFVSMFFVVPLTLVMCWPSPHAAAVLSDCSPHIFNP